MTRPEITKKIIKEILSIPEGEYTRDWQVTRIRQDLKNLVDERILKLKRKDHEAQ